MVRRITFAVTVLLLAGSLLIGQQPPRSDTHPPGENPHLKNQASIRNGMLLYRVQCGDCHGLDARGYRLEETFVGDGWENDREVRTTPPVLARAVGHHVDGLRLAREALSARYGALERPDTEELLHSSWRYMGQATAYEHIRIDESGVPTIAGTTMKVVELVLETIAYGWSPDELQFQHPYLTLGQIHSALAYYWDHKEDLDADIERRLERVDRIKREVGPSELVARLRARGLLA